MRKILGCKDLLRIVPVGAGPDTLLLEQGNRLLRGLQRLLTAAARPVMEPMPSLVGKKPREVTAYIPGLSLRGENRKAIAMINRREYIEYLISTADNYTGTLIASSEMLTRTNPVLA